MNRFKLNVGAAAVAVVALALSVSAFTTETTTANEKWYEFIGTDPQNLNHYQLVNGDGSNPASCEEGIDVVCSIFAEPSGTPGKPDLSTVVEEMTTYRQE